MAILLYLLPSAYIASYGLTAGFVFIVSLIVIAYALASILAALPLLIALVPPSKSIPPSLAWLPLLVALALPAFTVTVLGRWGSVFWHLVYLLSLPSGLLIAAHVALLAGLVGWGYSASAPLLLALAALVGSMGSFILVVDFPLGGSRGAYSLADGMLILAFASDVGLALWFSRTLRRERPQAP